MNKYFFKGLQNKKIIIFSTGLMSECISMKLKNPIAYFVDNNVDKWGTKFLNKNIYSPKELEKEEKDVVIIVASMYYDEILKQLNILGFRESVNVINGNLLFVNLLDEKVEIAIQKEYGLFSKKISTYLEYGFTKDIEQFLTKYEGILPLDDRIGIIREIISVNLELNSEKLESLIKLISSKSNSNFDLYYEYYLATQCEESGEYALALNYYEKVLARGVSKNHKKMIIRKINKIEEHYKKEILKQLNRKKEVKTNNSYFVHLIIDSFFCNLFIKYIKKHFKKDKHVFITLMPNKHYRYLEEDVAKDVKNFNFHELKYEKNAIELKNHLLKSQKIFIHSLTNEVCWLLSRYEIESCINWIIWGGDLYPYINFELYDELTKQFLFKANLSEKYLLDNFEGEEFIFRKSAIRKLNGILSDKFGDYNLACKHFLTKAKYQEFMYINVVDLSILDALQSPKQTIKNEDNYVFLIGNSGYPTNNHIEIFEVLKKYREKNIVLVTPLSYGDPIYIEKIIEQGKKLFGDKFRPITEFLNPKDYGELLMQVDVAFMNHNRQQAGGNISGLLYLMKKVFMKPQSTLYQALKSKSIEIGNIKELKTMDFDEIVRIDKLKLLENRKKITNIRKEEYKKNLYQKLFN